jgi:signal peptide peptidase SppA
MKYPHLAARIFNTPLLIHPQKLDAIIAGLGPRLLGGELQLSGELSLKGDPGMFSTAAGEDSGSGYTVVNGVAVLNVNGALVHRSQFLMADSTYLLGYNELAANLESAMADPEVHAVLQVYESPGGEAQGAFEYGQRVFDLRGKKPMYAIADGMALSAAYLGACAADELVITTTGYAGSIGVCSRHVDFSKALADDGIVVTNIFAGSHKVDGNQFEPLPDAVRADWQQDIDGLYAMFTGAVAQYRGMSVDAVVNTQAQTYRGVAAIAAGLADRISTTDQLISELAALRTRSISVGPTARSTADKGVNMSGNTTEAGGQTPTNPAAPAAFAQADVDGARAAGATAERTRVSGILTHEKAGANMAMAVQCVTSGLSVEQAGAILGAAPAPAAAAPAANGFAAAMALTGNPQVSGIEGGAAGAGGDAAAEAAALAGQVMASFRGGAATPAKH